jgi:restriction endonuclease S subunit
VYIDEMTNDKMKTSSLMTGDLIISKIGRVNTENSSLGRTAIYEGENRKANISGNLCYVRLNNSVVPKFVLRILTLERYRRWAMQTTLGGIDKRAMSVSQISNFPIITPPIGLQQTFVSKIESIEKQKELIAQSIKETETLFNSRMDYYFN